LCYGGASDHILWKKAMPFRVFAVAIWHRRAALAAALAINCAPGLIQSEAQAGPTSALYLTDSSVGGAVYVVQNGAVINSWTGVPAPNAPLDSNPTIAVGETVRTYPQGFVPGALGAEYSLNGVPTGATYPNTVGCCFRDGTTDGVVYNYAIRDIPGLNAIYRFNRDWTDPEVLVLPGLAGLGDPIGITFDPRNNSLWIAQANLVFNATLGGDVPAIFLLDSTFDGALAFDSADNTLWLVDSEPSVGTIFEQFSSVAGFDRRDPLDTFVLPPFGGLIRGAEFALTIAAVPEPPSWALMIGGVALLGGALRRRKVRLTSA
jgi:hypothetical protein